MDTDFFNNYPYHPLGAFLVCNVLIFGILLLNYIRFKYFYNYNYLNNFKIKHILKFIEIEILTKMIIINYIYY